MIFIPNFNTSSAELVFPAADLSQSIATAGAQLYDSSSIKMILNGGLILGTQDGTNQEIAE